MSASGLANILIIENDLFFGEGLSDILKDNVASSNVYLFRDLESVPKKFLQSEVSLIVFRLLNFEGVPQVFFRNLKNKFAYDLNVLLIVSGFAYFPSELKSLGAREVIESPFSFEQLIDRVQEIITNPSN